MSLKLFAVIAGIALVVVGLFVGFGSSEVQGPVKSYTCGSAFSEDTADAAYKDSLDEIGATLVGGQKVTGSLVAQCHDKQGSKSTIAWLLIGFGVLGAAGGALVKSKSE